MSQSKNKKLTIHFAHANGFPSPCYNKFFRILRESYDISYIDSIGHDEDYPVTQNWKYLVRQLMHRIEQHHSEPVIGVGHSLGGVLTFLASIYKPELFKAIVLMDSPIYGRFKSHMIKAFKLTGYIDKVSPSGRTLNRRQTWESPQEAFDHLQAKTVFKNFDSDAMWDYINYGMDYNDGQVRLKFNKDIEYKIYRTFPHNLFRYKKRLSVPAGLLYGEHSHVIGTMTARSMARQLNLSVKKVRGGHLFPFEHPEAAAQGLMQLLDAML